MGIVRLLLALSVVIDHSNPIFGWRLAPGSVAVQQFFIISGFYMALVLSEKYFRQSYASTQQPSWFARYRLFLEARVLRLYPAYLTVLFLTIAMREALVIRLQHKGHHAEFLAQAGCHLSPEALIYICLSNLFLLGQDAALFLGVNPQSGLLHFTSNFSGEPFPVWEFMLIPPAWSLSLEIIFYMMAPFIVRQKTTYLVVLALTSLGLRFILHANGLSHDPWNYRFFPVELMFFLSGVLAYRGYVYIRDHDLYKPAFGWASFSITCLSIILYNQMYFPGKIVLYFFVFSAILPFLFLFTKANSVDRLIGDLSFPVYIVHWLVINSLGLLGKTGESWIISATIVVSIALLLMVDIPIDRFRQRIIADRGGIETKSAFRSSSSQSNAVAETRTTGL